MFLTWLRVAVLVACALGCVLSGCVPRPRAETVPAVALVSPGASAEKCGLGPIENAFRIGPRLYSGGEPHGDAAFAALAAAGVRTLVSVDGARPDVEGARRHGLRYVHVPIGYDGIGGAELAALVAVSREAGGGVFVHCHHGRHRGPTAVAIVAQASGAWDAAQAEAWQKLAGTSPDYAGLYRVAREFKMPEAEAVAKAVQGLRPAVEPIGLVEMMVRIDGQTEVLSDMKGAGWRALPGQPDETPVQVARLLHEQFREGLRLGLGPKETEFVRGMRDSEAASGALLAALAAGDGAGADAAWKQVKDLCTRCHKGWRNNGR